MKTKKEHSRNAITALISAVFIFVLSISQLSAEPYVYYRLDGDGTDAGSNGLDLVVNEDQLIWVEGIHGQAAFIKEGEGFNPLSMNEMYGTGDWTIEGWVKIDSFDNRQFHLMSAGSFTINYCDWPPRSFGSWNPATTIYQLPYSLKERWFHFAVIYRVEQSVQLFINGEKVSENTPRFNFDFSSDHSLYIGRSDWSPSTSEFSIDEVAIHNAALEPEEFIGMQYYVEQPKYTINGHIADSSTGEGLPGVVVTAEPGGFVAATDIQGDFTIDLPFDGEFTVSLKKTNYASTSEQGVVVAADIPATVNAALERISSSSIVADYHFDGNGEDASVNGYDFIVNDNVTWTDGIRGKAAVLDSVYFKNELRTPAFETNNRPIYPGIGDFSCEILMYFHDPEGRSPMFMFSNQTYGMYTMWYRSVEYRLTVYLDNYNDRLSFTVPIEDYFNEWIHIAWVYRYKQSFQFYINGELIAEEVTDFIPDIYPEGTFSINAYERKFIVDEVRISNTALSPEQFLFMETHVEDSPSPSEFSITGNYPNPFNPSTTIEFTLPETGHVNLGIYNITGQKIRELVSGTIRAGTHSIVWDGKDENGMIVPSGIYMSRLVNGGHVAAKKMLLMK